MSLPEDRSRRVMLRRISELEARLEQARRRADSAESELAHVKSSIWWKTVSRLRRALLPRSNAARSDGMLPLARQRREMWRGVAADFIACLPPEAVVGLEDARASGARALRRIDFQAVMTELVDSFDRSAQRLEAASATAAGVSGAPDGALRIAFIGSDELHRDLAFDASLSRIDRSGWRDQLSADHFDFLLIECRTQHPSHTWAAALAGDSAAGGELRALLSEARRLGLPSAIWMLQGRTENPRAGDWMRPLVDAVFETDPVRAGQREGYPSRKTEWLPPGIQPKLYNPVTVPSLLKAARYGRKCVLFDQLETCVAAESLPRGLEPLLDRLLLADSRWSVPEDRVDKLPQLAGSSLGSIGEFDRAALLRLVGAEIMPRPSDGVRALQAQACGALVVDLAALEHASGNEADAFATRMSDPLARARAAHLHMRRVLTEDCMETRLERMAAALDLPRTRASLPTIACLLVSRRPGLLAACLQRFRAELYPEKELVIVVHRDDADLSAIRAMIRPGEPVRIFQMGEQWGLGACLNLAFAQTGAQYWAKWDDDDFYGPHYLSDFMLYRRAVDFDIAGKPRAFSWFEQTGELRWDERWAARANVLRTPADTRNTGIAGATLVGHRRVLEATPFPEDCRRGTDSEFLRRAIDHGWNILSTDPFNFVRFRAADSSFHTWQIQEPEAEILTQHVGGSESVASVAFI